MATTPFTKSQTTVDPAGSCGRRKTSSHSTGNVDLTSPLSELPRLLNISDAARALCVSRRTIYKLIESGELRLHRIGSTGALRIRRDDLEALIVAEV